MDYKQFYPLCVKEYEVIKIVLQSIYLNLVKDSGIFLNTDYYSSEGEIVLTRMRYSELTCITNKFFRFVELIFADDLPDITVSWAQPSIG